MATAEATPIERGAQLRLPRFGKYKVPQARIAFGGALELALTSPEDIELIEALTLGAEGTVTLAVDGVARTITLGCGTTSETHKFRKTEDRDDVVKVLRLVINGVHEDDDPDGEE